MDDTEVGEIWRDQGQRDCHRDRAKLIRKLVEERADYYREVSARNNEPLPNYQLEIDHALRDFGIDKKTW